MTDRRLTPEFYREAHAEFGCFPRSLEILCAEATRIARSPEETARFFRLVKTLEHPEHWEGDESLSKQYEMLPALAVLSFVPQTIRLLMEDGFSLETAVNSSLEVENELMEVAKNHGAPGFNAGLVQWFCIYLRRDIIRIGRFNFERSRAFDGQIRVYEDNHGEEIAFACDISINAHGGAVQEGETEAFFATFREEDGLLLGHRVVDGKAQREITCLKKEDWTLRLKTGDPVLHMHIPAAEPFDPACIQQSYREGLRQLSQCWTDLNPKALVCKSWLMDPVLREFLPERSNILAFARPYTVFPSPGNITSALDNVFGGVPEDYHDLPENTSLQRALKAHYLAGDCVRFTYAYRLLPEHKESEGEPWVL